MGFYCIGFLIALACSLKAFHPSRNPYYAAVQHWKPGYKLSKQSVRLERRCLILSNFYLQLERILEVSPSWVETFCSEGCLCIVEWNYTNRNFASQRSSLAPSLVHLVDSNCTVLCRPVYGTDKSWNCSPHHISSEVFAFHFLITVANLSFEQEKKDTLCFILEIILLSNLNKTFWESEWW